MWSKTSPGKKNKEKKTCENILGSYPATVKKTKKWKDCNENNDAILVCQEKGYKVTKFLWPLSFSLSLFLSLYLTLSFSLSSDGGGLNYGLSQVDSIAKEMKEYTLCKYEESVEYLLRINGDLEAGRDSIIHDYQVL